MNEKPILYSAPMVRAIIAGDKTQTRRVIKPQPEVSPGGYLTGEWLRKPLSGLLAPKIQDIIEHCPYGEVGGHLWVRETWATNADCDNIKPSDINRCAEVYYRADGSKREVSGGTGWNGIHQGFKKGKYRPSIFMPRAFSRILLEVTDIRVERLQDISEDDAENEGVDFLRWIPDADETLTAKELFWCLWDSINAAKHPWESNPWVWALSFKRVE